MHYYSRVLKNYAVFEGRARRKEYWMFVLFNLLISFALRFLEHILGGATATDQSVLSTIYQLAVLLPSLAVGVRRMHDVNRSGWWLLVPIANFIFSITEGDLGDNKYGTDPKR